MKLKHLIIFTYEKVKRFATNRDVEFEFDPICSKRHGQDVTMLFESQADKTCIVQETGLIASPPWFQIEHEEQVDKIMVSTRLKNIGQIGYFPLIWG